MSMRTEARKWTGVCDDSMRGRRVTRIARSPIFNITTVMADNLHQDVPGSAQFPFKLSGYGTSYCIKM